MVLSMGLMIPIGVLIPMAFRGENDDAWFRYHRLLRSTGVLILLIGISVALANVSMHMIKLHHKLGVAIFVLTLLQPLNAVIRPHKEPPSSSTPEDNSSSNNKQSTTKRTIWEVVHKGLGRIIVLASFVNIF